MSSEYSAAYLAEDRRQLAMVGIVVVTALSFIVVMIRLYARRVLIRELGWDDLFILLAQLTSWATMALCMMLLRYGSGRHLAALVSTPETLVKMYKWLVTTQLVYMFNLWLCRVSGLAFYARINPMPQFILYLRVSFAFISAVYIAQTLIIALQCIPLAALWGAVEGKCMGSKIVFVSTGALTIACDSLILILPLKIVLSLQTKLARKLALLGILCFGIFAVVTSILRMISMIVSIEHEDDITWYFSPVIAWTCAEISAGIIALSLPALRSIFGFLKEKRSTKDQSYSNGSRGIGLDSVSRKRQRIFHGPNGYENTTEIDCARSPSQEALWDRRTDQKIRVMDTVNVEIHG
ncbi:uncharacterized protein N7496_010782 [Penicillium cataractarum]|uniref:Rhodopsin domain-containing protein n=1 Tax=Penicillium cataractarum TaxID=2100454 RepID=A0A9W9RGA0_9EURO|nr:uncharacterized protein N7496_010782 [Penicillium cataractarum]KAJ5358369.1 hypothetical protein N7496_010782 [Penicillium cataractarum]